MQQSPVNNHSRKDKIIPDNDLFSFIMKISRSHNKKFPLPTTENKVTDYVSFIDNTDTSIIKFSYTLEGNDVIDVPTVVMCGAIQCTRINPSDESQEDVDDVKRLFGSQLLVCNDISFANVFISANLFDHKNMYSEKRSRDDLLDDCMDKIHRAIDLGYSKLKSRHIEYFSSKMKRVQLHFDSNNETNTCAQSPTTSRLKSFANGCVNVSEMQEEIHESTLPIVSVLTGICGHVLPQCGRELECRHFKNMHNCWHCR